MRRSAVSNDCFGAQRVTGSELVALNGDVARSRRVPRHQQIATDLGAQRASRPTVTL
jgi:hypothetical protein